MNIKARWIVGLTLACASASACSRPAPARASGEGGWVAGKVGEKFDTVAKQLYRSY